MNTESSTSIPLAVDLDGTLIRSDMLLETFVLLIKRNPLYLFLIPLWLLRGKAALKAEIASRVIFNPAALPYVQPLIDWLRSQRQRGRAVWLCTASDRRLAQAVADHLQIFDGALGSDGQFNMSGSNKARVLVERFGEQGFDYCGNHFADRNVWRHARAAVVVNGGGRLEALVRADGTPVEAIFAHPGGQIKAAIKAMRPPSVGQECADCGARGGGAQNGRRADTAARGLRVFVLQSVRLVRSICSMTCSTLKPIGSTTANPTGPAPLGRRVFRLGCSRSRCCCWPL